LADISLSFSFPSLLKSFEQVAKSMGVDLKVVQSQETGHQMNNLIEEQKLPAITLSGLSTLPPPLHRSNLFDVR
jgi:hypothetical protein